MPRKTKRLAQSMHSLAEAQISKKMRPTLPVYDLPLTEEERAVEIVTREWEDHSDDDAVVFDFSDDEPVLDKDIGPSSKGKFKASAYDEMMNSASTSNWEQKETALRMLVMKGDSERNHFYLKRKAQDLAEAAKTISPITNWLHTASKSPLPPLPPTFPADEEENVETKSDISWETEILTLELALGTNKNLSKHTLFQLQQIKGYMILRQNGHNAMKASAFIAEVNNRGPYFARVIRQWTHYWIAHHIIPHFQQGCHIKVKSLLEDEDVELAVSSYLRQHKFTVTPMKLKDHWEKEIFLCLQCW